MRQKSLAQIDMFRRWDHKNSQDFNVFGRNSLKGEVGGPCGCGDQACLLTPSDASEFSPGKWLGQMTYAVRVQRWWLSLGKSFRSLKQRTEPVSKVACMSGLPFPCLTTECISHVFQCWEDLLPWDRRHTGIKRLITTTLSGYLSQTWKKWHL
jgi:hypothetical protein